VGGITSDREFLTVNVPSQTIVFDSLTDPTVVALFTFRTNVTRSPDRVVFGQWRTGQYDYTVTPGRTFSDSSVMVYWDAPVTVAAGATEEFAFYYGIGGISFFNSGPFSIGVVGPNSLTLSTSTVATYEYLPNPFSVTAFFQNISGLPISGARAALRLPVEFTIAPTDTLEKDLEETVGSGVIDSTGIAQVSWALTTRGRHQGRRRIAFQQTSNGATGVFGPIIVRLPGLANGVFGQVTDPGGTAIAGASVDLYQGDTRLAGVTSASDGTYIFTGLASGRYTLRITGTGYPDTILDAVVTDDASSGLSTNPVPQSGTPVLQVKVYPSPVREGNAYISFYTDTAIAAEVKIFTLGGEEIAVLPASAAVAGWRQVAWTVDGVANGVYLYEVKAGGQTKRGKISVVKWKARS
jgi:hypothetical protein